MKSEPLAGFLFNRLRLRSLLASRSTCTFSDPVGLAGLVYFTVTKIGLVSMPRVSAGRPAPLDIRPDMR